MLKARRLLKPRPTVYVRVRQKDAKGKRPPSVSVPEYKKKKKKRELFLNQSLMSLKSLFSESSLICLNLLKRLNEDLLCL